LLTIKALLVAASFAIAMPVSAQLVTAPSDPPAEPAEKPEYVVEGATPDRVAQVEQCQGQKFESRVEIDPVKKRSTRIKLCADPGASDAEWVKTLEAAVVQIEQRNMPAEARQKLIGELEREIARYPAAPTSAPAVQGAILYETNPGAAERLAGPTERFETSVLPPLPAPKKASRTAPNSSSSSPPQKPMRIALKCLERGQTGAGGTCDFLESTTLLVVRAVEGLDDGGTLRFRRRGDVGGEVALPRLTAGQSARVKLPAELCRGVANTRAELELMGPKSNGVVAARLGPYYVRC